jgi:hypothetical protein
LQLLGGRGFCDNSPIGQLWRDRVTRLFEGLRKRWRRSLASRFWTCVNPATTPGSQGRRKHRQTLECLRAEGPAMSCRPSGWAFLPPGRCLQATQQAHAGAWAEARLAQARQRLLSDVPHADVACGPGRLSSTPASAAGATPCRLRMVLDDWMTQVCP